MEHQKVRKKLNAFIQKYNQYVLIRGLLLFLLTGLLYFIFIAFLENTFWFPSNTRYLLFWLVCLGLGLFLLLWVIWPFLKTYYFKKGLDDKNAALLIKSTFPDTQDKLINWIELNNTPDKNNELIEAALNQKSKSLSPLPFKKALPKKKIGLVLKAFLVPLLIFLVLYVTKSTHLMFDSSLRIFNYNREYIKPAPFQFVLSPSELQTIEGNDFRVHLKIKGAIVPEKVLIHFEGASFYMQQKGSNLFTFNLKNLKQDLKFRFSAQEYFSTYHLLEVIPAPALVQLETQLKFPSYTFQKNLIIKNTGNATVPEGTRVTWKVSTKNATKQQLISQEDTLNFLPMKDKFSIHKTVKFHFKYQLVLGNSKLPKHEVLPYEIQVIKDAYPKLKIKNQLDSLLQNELYFYGQASDDYGLSGLKFHYYPKGNKKDKKTIVIPVSKSSFQEFYYSFPGPLDLKEGVPYTVYFELWDNDAVNGAKSTKSRVFDFNHLSQKEKSKLVLNEQIKAIEKMNQARQIIQSQNSFLEDLSQQLKAKKSLSFQEKNQLSDLIQRRNRQNQLIKKHSRSLNDLLNKENNKNSEFKDLLRQNLQAHEKELANDEKLLEEIKKWRDKLDPVSVQKQLEKLQQQNQQKSKNLSQILELTKRYYISQKASQLKKQYLELSQTQDSLSHTNTHENEMEKQSEINKQTKELNNTLNELEEENKSIQTPLPNKQTKILQESAQKAQKEVIEKLSQKETSEDQINNKQKEAAERLLDISNSLKGMEMSSSGKKQLQEDANALRAILENLLQFSFQQEALHKKVKILKKNENVYSNNLKAQGALRKHFGHIDDSLFALSLRQPMVSPKINKPLSDIYYYLDETLKHFPENQIAQIAKNQRQTIHSTNILSDFLSDLLHQMNQQLQKNKGSGGSGQGNDAQLSDIIIEQKQLEEKLNSLMQNSNNKGEGQNNEVGKEKGGQNKDKGSDKQPNTDEEEGFNGKIYQIFKEQQQLRNALEELQKKSSSKGKISNLIKAMEKIEDNLINGQVDESLKKEMESLRHELLKLSQANYNQNKSPERESKTSIEVENKTPEINYIQKAKNHFPVKESLLKNPIPVLPLFKEKIRFYFSDKPYFKR